MPHRETTHDSTFAPLTPTSDRPSGWARVKEVGAVVASAVTVGAVLGTLLTTLGFRVQGPPQDVAAISVAYQRADSALVTRVVRLEVRVDSTAAQLRDLGEDVRFLSYMQCMRSLPNDPQALEKCSELIRRGWRTRGTP